MAVLGRYLIVGAVCTLIGVVGYQMYGSEVMEEVTLNLPSGALAMLATALIVVNPFTKVRATCPDLTNFQRSCHEARDSCASTRLYLLVGLLVLMRPPNFVWILFQGRTQSDEFSIEPWLQMRAASAPCDHAPHVSLCSLRAVCADHGPCGARPGGTARSDQARCASAHARLGYHSVPPRAVALMLLAVLSLHDYVPG